MRLDRIRGGWLVVLIACGAPAAPPPAGSLTPVAYDLAGAEYWPYAGAADIDYPGDVLWGFYRPGQQRTREWSWREFSRSPRATVPRCA